MTEEEAYRRTAQYQMEQLQAAKRDLWRAILDMRLFRMRRDSK